MKELYPIEVWIRILGCICWTIFLSWFFYRDFYSLLWLWPIFVVLLLMETEDLDQKKKLKTEELFRELMESLATSLRAGYSLPNGFEEAYKELEYLHREKNVLMSELRKVVRSMKDGKQCEDMLEEIGKELRCVSMVELGRTLKVAALAGGNRNKILAHTIKTLKQKYRLMQEIEDGMAARRYEAKIMEIVPFLLVLYVEWGTPGFLDGLFDCTYGKGVMTMCLSMYLVAKIWMNRIVSRAMEV